jgi:hypothetical protein
VSISTRLTYYLTYSPVNQQQNRKINPGSFSMVFIQFLSLLSRLDYFISVLISNPEIGRELTRTVQPAVAVQKAYYYYYCMRELNGSADGQTDIRQERRIVLFGTKVPNQSPLSRLPCSLCCSLFFFILFHPFPSPLPTFLLHFST